MANNIISAKIVGYLGKTTKEIGKDLDNTEEMTKKVREILTGKSVLHRRLINAYPKIQIIRVKIKEKKDKIKRQMEEQKVLIKESVKKQKDELKEKIENIKEEKKEN